MVEIINRNSENVKYAHDHIDDFALLTNQTLLIVDTFKNTYCKLDELSSQIKSLLSIREGGVSTSQSKVNLPIGRGDPMDYTCQARNYNFPWVHMELYLNFYHTTLPKDMLVSIIISTKKRGVGAFCLNFLVALKSIGKSPNSYGNDLYLLQFYSPRIPQWFMSHIPYLNDMIFFLLDLIGKPKFYLYISGKGPISL